MQWIYIGAMVGIGLMLAPLIVVLAVLLIPLLCYAAFCALLYKGLGPDVLGWVVAITVLATWALAVAQRVWENCFPRSWNKYFGRPPEEPLTPWGQHCRDLVEGSSPSGPLDSF